MSWEPIKIGGKVLTLEKVKAEFQETKRALNAQELKVLLDDAWADTALVAYVLDMPVMRISAWCRSGKLKAVKKLGNWYIQLDQFRECFFLEDMPGRYALLREKKHIPKHVRNLRFDFFRELEEGTVGPLTFTGKNVPRRRKVKPRAATPDSPPHTPG